YYITYRRDYLVDFKEYDGGNILLGDGRECRVRGTGVIRKILKGRKQLGEYQTGWKITTVWFAIHGFWAEDTTMSTYLVNRSPSSATGFKTPIDMLEFFGWLASIKQWMLEPVKAKCIFLGYRKRYSRYGFNASVARR
ncbi:hypothetical protein Tco_0106525, partial [Tanacetum coccineum]